MAGLLIGLSNFLFTFLLTWPPFLGLILGILAVDRIHQGKCEGRGFAWLGIILNGFFALAVTTLVVMGAVMDFDREEEVEERVRYANCTEVRDTGAAPIHEGDPGYSRRLDRDGDGVGCE